MTSALGPSWLDAQHLIETFGLLGIVAIIFAECGLLLGFFLPGDTLLFSAGVLVQRDTFHQPLWLIIGLQCIAAIAGNQVGYEIGRRGGPAVFTRPDSRLFRPEYVERTSQFFTRYGPAAIVLGRFVPVVRTFITVMAGAARMDYRLYTIYTVLGGIFWATSVTLLGYFLGNVDFIANNIELLLLLGVSMSVVPVLAQLVLRRRQPKPPRG
ncbi:MAG: rane-associated protein [Actinomycetota bacterium]|nr:rane-associated protein [Actinomycetota bacterium]MDQ1668679.1 rane-associated protein [Actinomycetota bacterium]